jgi:hypothetical protein
VERKELVQSAFEPPNSSSPTHGASDSQPTLFEQQNQGLSTVNLVNNWTKVLLCMLAQLR